MAQEVQNRRIIVASRQPPPSLQFLEIGQEGVYRFLQRHPELQACYSCQLDSHGAKDATPEKIQAWYDAFQARLAEQNYRLEDIYIMDKTSFAVGGTRTTRIIVNSSLKSNWKVTAGKQEWITVLECVSAAGEAFPTPSYF